MSLITSWRHSRTDITWQGEWLWETERVCQTYNQIDNSNSHSLWLFITLSTPHLTPDAWCPLFAAWATALSRDPASTLFPESGWWREVIIPHTSLFFPSSREKSLGKEWGWRGWRSCEPGLNKVELVAWWGTGCFAVAVQVLDWDRVKHSYQSWEVLL